MREHYVFGRTLTGELTDEVALEILREAQQRRERIAKAPIDRVLTILDSAAKLWANPEYEGRRQVMERIPAQIGFSPEMVAQELKGLEMALSRTYLEEKLKIELGSLDALEMWQGGNGAAFKRALPRGVTLHVSSGNVFTGGILSMIEGILTKNVNLLKAASKAPLFPLLFAKSLKECDPEGLIANSIAILSWSGGKSKVHRVFQQYCDTIVVWGGEEVVREYREGLSLKTHLVEYGPKVSFAVVSAERLDHPEVPRQLARSIALWDQNACSSPQVLYLEDGSATGKPTEAFVGALRQALDEVQDELPQGPLTKQERAEVTKEREMARFEAAMGTARLITPGSDPYWTIIVETDPGFKLSPLFRTIYVKRVPDLAQVPDHLAEYADYLQTAGLSVPPNRLFALAQRLMEVGVLRVTPLAEMSGGTPGEPHDGLIALNELVKWVSIGFEEAGDRFDGAEWLSQEELEALSFSKRQRLLEVIAPQAPFHRDRLKAFTLTSPEEWAQVPLMEREDIHANTPPLGDGLFAQTPAGAHFLRSGGSTNVPKLSAFSYEDYEEDMRRAARGAFAIGLRRGDRVANLFYSGSLHGSFLSVNRAIELVGGNNFPIAHTASPEQVVHLLSTYGIDTLMGTPSWLLRIFDEIKASGAPVRIRKVCFTGEHMYPPEQAYLRETFGVETIASIGYGTVDAGPIGFQCSFSSGGVHHIHADHQHVELVHPETGGPVGLNEVGEILITNLNRSLMPLVRYRIGDLGRWVEGPCPCGRQMPRIDLLGRSDDVFIIGGMNMPYADLQRAASTVAEINSTVQIVVKRVGYADSLEIRAERLSQVDGVDASELEARLREGILAQVSDLNYMINKGALAELKVEVMPPGALPRHERTGKFQRIVDKRI